jgi:hypothetical protein
MVLLLGLAAGWLVGVIRAWLRNKPYSLPEFSKSWLVLAALIPQVLAFQIPATARWFSERSAAVVLVSSLVILLVFVWFNRERDGIVIIGLGLALNLLVIAINGGLMPIAPETVTALFPDVPRNAWQIGTRPGRSKNIILLHENTRLADLSDAILLPEWFPWIRALSPGDLLIVLGVFWLLAFEWEQEPSSLERAQEAFKEPANQIGKSLEPK